MVFNNQGKGFTPSQSYNKDEEENAQLEEQDFDPANSKELQILIRNKLPITLPWHREKCIRLGTCLHSSRLLTDNPWQDEDSPFLLAQLFQIPPVLKRDYGTIATFTSTSTSLQCNTKDHLSLGFGIGVGIPFLASVSVKGSYDKDVEENKDSNKASVRASIRSGSVELARQPRLTNQAITVIKHGGGLPAFEDRYGDYYVAGYRLGGDTAMLLSSSHYSSKEKEVFGVTVTVEVLFFEASKHWEKDFNVFTSGTSLKLLGYDTLSSQNWKEVSEAGDDGARLFAQSKEIALSTQCLDGRLSKILDAMGLHDGQELTRAQCDELIRSGIVVELVLMPIRTV